MLPCKIQKPIHRSAPNCLEPNRTQNIFLQGCVTEPTSLFAPSWCTREVELLDCAGDSAPEQISQRGGGISLTGDIQGPSGCSVSSRIILLEQGGWSRCPTVGPFQPDPSCDLVSGRADGIHIATAAFYPQAVWVWPFSTFVVLKSLLAELRYYWL